MTADLLAVLREAREALESVSLALPVTQWARTIDAIGNTLARIDSALRAHEAQGWRPEPWELASMQTIARALRAGTMSQDLNNDAASWLEKFAPPETTT